LSLRSFASNARFFWPLPASRTTSPAVFGCNRAMTESTDVEAQGRKEWGAAAARADCARAAGGDGASYGGKWPAWTTLR
jgi:hypothetical protein